MTAQIVDAIKGIRSTDIVIAFMGPSGSGKSFFIDLLTGQLGRRSGNLLTTQNIEATRMPLPRDPHGRHLALVEIPGFDDTTRSDLQILSSIGDWLKGTHGNGVKLSGLIYLHRITDNRMAGAPYKNLRMFGQLCGNMAMSQVLLVSTMWGRVNPEICCAREKELKEVFWKNFIDQGADVDRLQDTTSEAAWQVVSELIGKKPQNTEVLLLQEEMVDLGIELKETQAGKILYNNLKWQLAEQNESLASLGSQIEKSGDPTLQRQLKKEYDRIQLELDRTSKDVKTLRISSSRRLFLSLFAKKTRSKAVIVGQGFA